MSSCQKAPELTLTGPTSFELSADGGSATINFAANRDWRVSSSDNWITVSPSSGTAANGTIAVTVKCNANTTYDDRMATVTISMEGLSQSVTVKQSANSGVLVPKTSYEISSGAQTIEVEVQKNINYTVEIEESCKSWIKKVGTKALTSEKIVFDISENTSYDARKGTITIIPFTGPEQTIVVNQAARSIIIVPSNAVDVSDNGGEINVTIQATVEFDVKPEVDWIHYVQTKALNTKTVVLSVDKNDTYNTREGTVTIKQRGGDLVKTIDIIQISAAVDLGITMKREDGSTYRVYWATRNLGASSPYESGDRYAWGEVETKEDFSWETYKWANGVNKFTKYCSSARAEYNWGGTGDADNKTVLDPEDDAAHVILGGKWRMPTKDELIALFEQCTVSRDFQNYRFIIKSKDEGNNAVLYLPVQGYWSSELPVNNPSQAYTLLGPSTWYENQYATYVDKVYVEAAYYRFQAGLIRPVTE